MNQIVKICKTHGNKKADECYPRNGKLSNGTIVVRYECRECVSIAKKKWTAKNPGKNRDYKFKDWPKIIGDGPLICVTCKETKNQTDFHKHMLKNKHPRCIVCMKECLRRYRLNNPKQFSKTQKEHRAKNKEHYSKMIHRSKLRIYFDMTTEDYDALLERQDYACAICKKPETKKHKGTVCRLCVDHCHKTGRIRGLLCDNCNIGLGRFKDSKEYLVAAALYLDYKVT